MRCWVVFSHPGNGTRFYFKDLRDSPSGLRPVGCCMLRRYRDRACIFETTSDARKLCAYLISIGCTAYPVKLRP